MTIKTVFAYIKCHTNSVVLFIVSNVITAILSSIIALIISSYYENRNNWAKIDSSVTNLMYKIILAENDPKLKAPPHSATKLEKLVFIRQTQIERHFTSWNLVKTHLPTVSSESTLEEWSGAISGHESIEIRSHEKFASLDKKAEYIALYSSFNSQNTIQIPIKTLASIYKLESDINDCPTCMKARKDLPVDIPDELVASERTVKGIAVAALPNSKKVFPIIDLRSPEISAIVKTHRININSKQRYFVPDYEALELIQNSGGRIEVFEDDVNSERK